MPSSPLERHLVRGFGRGVSAPAAPVRQRTAKSGGRIDLVRLVWLSAGLAAVAIYALGPSPTVRAVLFDGLGLGAFAAMSYRAARSAPGVRRGWALASAALLLWFAADATSDAYMLAGSELA